MYKSILDTTIMKMCKKGSVAAVLYLISQKIIRSYTCAYTFICFSYILIKSYKNVKFTKHH